MTVAADRRAGDRRPLPDPEPPEPGPAAAPAARPGSDARPTASRSGRPARRRAGPPAGRARRRRADDRRPRARIGPRVGLAGRFPRPPLRPGGRLADCAPRRCADDRPTVGRTRADVASNRLPMHSVPHTRPPRRSTAGGASSCSTRRTRSPGRPGARSTSRAAGRCSGSTIRRTSRPAALHQRPDAVRRDRRRSLPDANPTGVYERDFELPAEWLAGPADRPPRRRRRERADRQPSTAREVGISKDSHLAAEFDVTGLVRPGPNTIRLRVVKWSDATLHRGPGPVVARRHHPLRVPVRHAARPPGRRPRQRRPGRRPDDRDLRAARRRRLRRRAEPEPGWTVEARLGDLRAADRAGADRANAGPGRGSSRADSEPLSRHRFDLVGEARVGGPDRRASRRSGRPGAAAAPAARRPSRRCATEIPGVRRWSAEQPNLYPLARRRCARPSGEAVEEADLRVGFRRVEIDGLRPADQRRRRAASAASTATTSTSTPGASSRPSRCGPISWP